MKIRLQLYFLVLAGALMAFMTGCNSNDTWGSEPADNSGVKVTAFSLKNNADVLAHLDSVYFSINLMDGEIFNTTPLPYDTDVTALAVSISSDACSAATITFTADDLTTKSIDYLANADAKINFAHGAAVLHLVSADGSFQRDYKIRVNVASEKMDSLYWDKMESGALYGVAGMTGSKTVKVGDKAVMLSMAPDGSKCITTFIPAAKSGGGVWESSRIYPSFDIDVTSSLVDVESFTATEKGELFLIDNAGNLFRSIDGGATMSCVDRNWIAITTAYMDGVVGIKRDGAAMRHASYPASLVASTTPVADDFPIKGFSTAVSFSSNWATKPQSVIIGGTNSDGNLSGAAWAFDGSRWARLSDRLPAGEGYSLAKYTIAVTDTASWRIRRREVLIAFGGNSDVPAASQPSNKVWVSRDMGLNWAEGSDLLQLPDYIPFTTGGQLLVFDKTLTADAVAMAVAPITSWQCPYLYLFGGYDEHGILSDSYWSGVVNHLTMKPIQ